MGKIVDLNGRKFGRWTVIGEGGRSRHKRVMWRCICECGAEREVVGESLINGISKSCGCYKTEATISSHTTHGKSNNRLYTTWNNMKRRCNNKNNTCYKLYGERGIKVCEEWEEFENFYEWAVDNGYNDKLTIDRIDVNGDYCPENCRWVTQQAQTNNTRRNRYITYNGETHTAAEWSRITGINYKTLLSRLNRGIPIEDALSKK